MRVQAPGRWYLRNSDILELLELFMANAVCTSGIFKCKRCQVKLKPYWLIRICRRLNGGDRVRSRGPDGRCQDLVDYAKLQEERHMVLTSPNKGMKGTLHIHIRLPQWGG